MSKIHFLIGATSTEAVSVDQTVLVMLPETIRPAVVPTYAGQLQAGVKALVRLGSEKNLFTNHFLPCVGAVDQNIFLAKRRDLELTESEVESLRGDVWKRAGVFIAYLISHHLIDRKLYPVLEKHRRQAPLTSKDLNSLVDMIYGSLRRTAGATASRKQKIRDYIESGEYEASLMDWLARFVNPIFGLFEKAIRLTTRGSSARKPKPFRP